jgi:hypothetical protein
MQWQQCRIRFPSACLLVRPPPNVWRGMHSSPWPFGCLRIKLSPSKGLEGGEEGLEGGGQLAIALHSPDVVLLQRGRRTTNPDGLTFGRHRGRSCLRCDGPPLRRNHLAVHRRSPPPNIRRGWRHLVWRGGCRRSPTTQASESHLPHSWWNWRTRWLTGCSCLKKMKLAKKNGKKIRVVKVD